jgi:hypothetical protein
LQTGPPAAAIGAAEREDPAMGAVAAAGDAAAVAGNASQLAKAPLAERHRLVVAALAATAGQVVKCPWASRQGFACAWMAPKDRAAVTAIAK